MNNANLISVYVWHNILKTNFTPHNIHQWYFKTHEHLPLKTQWSTTRIKSTTIFVHNELNYASFLFLIICNYMHKKYIYYKKLKRWKKKPNIYEWGILFIFFHLNKVMHSKTYIKKIINNYLILGQPIWTLAHLYIYL